MDEPIRSPFYQAQVDAGASFAEFGGWLMPREYSGVLAEHHAVRTAVGIFDVSHLGKITVSGPGSVDHLNALLTNDLGRIGAGQAQYSLWCAPDGGVLDDLIVYVHSDSSVLLVPNATNSTEVYQQVVSTAPPGVQVVNAHHDYAIIAVQGPIADHVMVDTGLLASPGALDYMHCVELARGNQVITVCRTGYTGERGYEVVIPSELAVEVWEALLAWRDGDERAIPCGLGARDTLRLEMGYPLHGHDLTRDINPIEAGLSWAVGWSKPRFQGDQRLRQLKAQGTPRRLRGLRALSRGIPRDHMAVLDANDSEIGVVTSGTFSPTLRQGIALALVPSALSEGTQVGVQVRSRVEPFEVASLPFVPSHVRP